MALSVALPLSGLETENFAYSTFGLRKSWEILPSSQSSRSPSISSDSSSVGSLGSLKSEPIISISAPSSPQNVEKVQKVQEQSPAPPMPEIQIMYKGRDILDLGRNISISGWKARYAHLPSNNANLFFANRSQYHRLSDFVVEHPVKKCQHCDYLFVDN